MNRIIIVSDGARCSFTLALIAAMRRIDCDAVMVAASAPAPDLALALPKIDAVLAPPEARRRKAQWKSELQGRRV